MPFHLADDTPVRVVFEYRVSVTDSITIDVAIDIALSLREAGVPLSCTKLDRAISVYTAPCPWPPDLVDRVGATLTRRARLEGVTPTLVVSES